MEGGGGELLMEAEDAPDVDAPGLEHERMVQMGHLPGGGGGGSDQEGMDVLLEGSCLDVEGEKQPRQELVGEEEEGGSARAEGAAEEVEAGLGEVPGEGAVSRGMEVEEEVEEEEEEEGVAAHEMDGEVPPGSAALASPSDAAEGEEEASTAGAVPSVVEDTGEGSKEGQPQHAEEQGGAEGAEVAEEGAVSHGMEADDEGIGAHEIEDAQLPGLGPLSSDFVGAEEKEEANSLAFFPAVDDDAIVDEDAAEEDEEEEEAASAMVVEEKELAAAASSARGRGGGRKRRGRPPKAQASRLPTKKKEEEDLCFICFDGGNLVVCDRRGCPKVYHPACVNRDESFFRSKGRWNCGWHICSVCEKAAHFMCLTCTYSLCKTCIKEAEFVCVRGNKGFCETCRSTVMLIETAEQEKKVAGVDFDDRNSWMYLFKDYWLDLKTKLTLTLEEILKAKNPWKGSLVQNEESSDELYDAKEDVGSSSDSTSVRREGNKPAKKKARRQSKSTSGDEEPVKLANTECTPLPEDSDWASEDLLEFVAHMRDGDKSVMCQFDVHTLLLEYIKRNNLRDPRRKSQIICDLRLEKLFGKARVGHFEMLKLLESHFLLKETSQVVTDDNQGGVVDPEFGQMDTEGNSEVVPRTSSDKKRRSRKRIEEREPQNNLDDYAAIDIHNISLIYLRRNLMEEFLDDTENFNDKVVGSFVRIRISGAGQRQDMYRLVQVVGTGKAAEKYKTGKRTTDITLEILNLSKMEIISIDSISNQEFTEEECDRLRQSIKCGLISRLTVGDILEKAMALQAVRVNESLENEKLRLSHLRDRASEKGRRKELRECVEKLQLLNSPEERSRRLNDVPEVHTDPNMDPNYESAEEESGDKKQDNFIRSTDSRFSKMGRELNSSLKGNLGSTDSWVGSRRGSTASWESSKNVSARASWDKVDTPSGSIDRANEMTLNQGKDLYQANNWDMSNSPATAAIADTGIWTGGQAAVKHGQSHSLSSEISTSQCTENVLQSNIDENEKMWHYQDPSGKIQGPFSMTQLRKWSTTGYFPANLRIWRTSEKQEESILLTDALIGKFQKEASPPEMQHKNLTCLPNVAQVMDARDGNCKGNWGANNNSWAEKKKEEGNLSRNETNFSGSTNLGMAKGDGWVSQLSGWSSPKMGPEVPRDGKVGGSSRVWESSKDPNAWSSKPQVHDVPPPYAAPFSANPNQLSAQQGRGRGSNAGRWKGGQGHGNTWGSNRPAAFHPSGHGYERQHSMNYVYPGHQSPGELWKVQAASNNQRGNDSLNLPTPTPSPSGGWMGGQRIGNQSPASLTVSVQPAVSGWASTATQGGNSLQVSSVAANEASKGGSAWVEQPPSTASTPSCWGPNPSLLKPTETAASWDSSATASIAVAKGRVLSDGSGAAHAPSLQNLPSISDRQTSLANDSIPKASFETEMVKTSSGKTDDFVSMVTSCNFQNNIHMKDDCPSPTPKDEQAKFDALLSESSQQNDVDVDSRKSFTGHDSFPSGSPIRSTDIAQYDTTSGKLEANRSYLASSTKNVPSGSETSNTKLTAGADNLGSLSSQKQSFEPSDPNYCSESQEKPSDLSERQETESLVLNPVCRGDGLEQSQFQNPNVHVLEPAKSGQLGLPAGGTEWSMPSPTPMIEPSVTHGGADPAFGISLPSSAQWNSNMHLDPLSLSNAGQVTGYKEIKHLGVGMSQENMNRGVEPGKESGLIDLGTAVQGTANTGLGTVVPGNASGVWANLPQGNTNVNAGWCPPPQGNANVNMFWLALAQANPSWGNSVQGNPNPNQNPGWVLTAPANAPAVSNWGAVAPPANPTTNQNWGPPVQGNANASSGWAMPQGNAHPNAGWFGQGNVNIGSNTPAGNPGSWGTQQARNVDGYPGHDDRGFQNNDADHGTRHGWNRSQSSGGGGSSWAPSRGQRMGGICKYHESGHCKKGANCNYLHT